MPDEKEKSGTGLPLFGKEKKPAKVGVEKEKAGRDEKEKKKWLALIVELLAIDKYRDLDAELERLKEKADKAKEEGASPKELEELSKEFGAAVMTPLNAVGFLVELEMDDDEREELIKAIFEKENDRELARELVEIAGRVDEGLSDEDKQRLGEVGKEKRVKQEEFFESLGEDGESRQAVEIARKIREVRQKILAADKSGEVRNELLAEMMVSMGGAHETRLDPADPGSTLEEKLGDDYAEVRGERLGPEWDRYIQLLEADVDERNWRAWYQHLQRLQLATVRLSEDGVYESRRRGLSADRQKKLTEFRNAARDHVDELMKQHLRRGDARTEFNWLTRDWSRAQIGTLIRSVDNDFYTDILTRFDDLSQLDHSMYLTDEQIEEADVLRGLLEGLDTIGLQNYISATAGRRLHGVDFGQEEADRINVWLGTVKAQLDEVVEFRRVPLTSPQLNFRVQEIQKGLVTGEISAREVGTAAGRGENGRRQAQPIPGEAIAAEGGPEGMVSPFAHKTWAAEVKTRLDKAKAEGRPPHDAIEWLFNFLIEKDLSERDQYYLMQNVKDYIAGAEGALVPGDAGKDMLLRAVYQEFLGQLQLFRALPGVQSEDQLFGLLSQISVGDMEDLMVYVKDYEDRQGIVRYELFDVDSSGRQTRRIHARSPGELAAFEVGGADIAAMLESKYWFNQFNFKTRGSPANGLRKGIMAEAIFLKLGGEIETDWSRSTTGQDPVRTYRIGGRVVGMARTGADVYELLKNRISLNFGDRGESMTIGEMAEKNLWVTVIGEMNWELSGKRGCMNKGIEGRRTVYRWDKHFQYDVYLAKLGAARGMDFLYAGYEEGQPRGKTEKHKPLLNTMRRDFVSVRAQGVLMPYLLQEGDLRRPSKDGSREVVLVEGVKTRLAGGDERLAENIVKLLGGRLFDSRKRLRDMEVVRNLFDRNALPDRVKDLAFNRAERDLLSRGKWDELFKYLLDRTGGTKLSQKEYDYFLAEMRRARTAGYRGYAAGSDQAYQVRGAELFFETLSRRRMFWEVDEQDRFQKEANYLKQTGAQAPKMAAYAANPSSDNMIEWLAPQFGFNPGEWVREVAYRNADAVLDARSAWSSRASLSKTDRVRKTVEWRSTPDSDGYPMPKTIRKFSLVELVHDPRATLKGWGKDLRGFIEKPLVVGGGQLSNFSKQVRMFVKGKAGVRGWEPMDAWGKKNYVDKLWHAGMIDWWQKERLMSRHVVPKIPIISDWLWRGIEVDVSKGKGFGKVTRSLHKVAGYGLYYIPSLVMRPAYLHLWIHDWGKASESFWNEVVAPGLAGEQAKAIQVPSG